MRSGVPRRNGSRTVTKARVKAVQGGVCLIAENGERALVHIAIVSTRVIVKIRADQEIAVRRIGLPIGDPLG